MNKINLPQVEMNADALECDLFYIWVANDEAKVVWLDSGREGICEYGTFEPDFWLFENNLIGELYGPINIPDAKIQEI